MDTLPAYPTLPLLTPYQHTLSYKRQEWIPVIAKNPNLLKPIFEMQAMLRLVTLTLNANLILIQTKGIPVKQTFQHPPSLPSQRQNSRSKISPVARVSCTNLRCQSYSGRDCTGIGGEDFV